MSTFTADKRTESPRQDRRDIYIDGGWVPSLGAASIEVVDPTTEQVIGSIPAGDKADVDAAVAAARAALPGWSAVPVEGRVELLLAIAEGIKARGEELAETVTREVGMPISEAQVVQAFVPALDFELIAAAAREYAFEERLEQSLVVREAIGVAGIITPWNFPVHQLASKTASALAAGCTVVAKPSELAPLNSFLLAEIIDAAGAPAGVFNLVMGTGPEVGEAIAAHPDVDVISFTGSTRAGRRVGELGSQTVKRVTLELGGKSANIILDDADLAVAIPTGVAKCFANTGQTCSALTRMLVPRESLAEVERIAVEAAEGYAIGDPLDPETKLGPLISAAQRGRVEGYIESGIADGARLLTGGSGAPEGQEQGFFVRPTVFSDVSPEMTIAREEIFGPVLSILPYESIDEAVAIANDSVYGLAAGVWSTDPARATEVARRLRTGAVEINDLPFDMAAPFGGYRQSGNGREMGRFGLEEFLETKALHGAV